MRYSLKHNILFLITFILCSHALGRSKNSELIRNIDYLKETAVDKYDWNDPAAKFLVLDNTKSKLTEAELQGLKKYALNAWLPTHNYMNYHFRKRMNSYMLEWLYSKDQDIALLNKAIDIAQRVVMYRNDKIDEVDTRFTNYQISYDRSVAPVWPNYKELEVYEDGSHGLAPGASGFAGLPMITIPVCMIANIPSLWTKEYKGKTYKAIALELAAEAQITLDYTYDVFVGEDQLIRYPNSMQRSEWHGDVYIYNRIFPVMSGAIPLAEAYETFNIHADKVQKIDKVNQAMLNFLTDDMTFHTVNGHECISYPYSDEAQSNNPLQSEDFTHGSFDSRDFQLFYKSGRYNFNIRYVYAMANTLVEVLDNGDGTFAARMNGTGSVKKSTPINYDGYIWYATYRPEVYSIINDYIVDHNIARKNNVYDAYCVFEMLKIKDQKTYSLVYFNDFKQKNALDDWTMEGPGIAEVKKGQLVLYSEYAEATQDYLAQTEEQTDNGVPYYDFVEQAMTKDIGDEVNDYKLNDKFMGGHIVLWNKYKTPSNYVLECDFESLSNYALHMLMFSHLGVNGECVFDEKLKPRNGLAHQYTKSDMTGYRVSFFAPDRKTTHLRKSPEKALLMKGNDFTLDNTTGTHHLKLIKDHGAVIWQIDGKTAFVYHESDRTQQLDGGYFAIRLVVPAMGAYDNFQVYAID